MLTSELKVMFNLNGKIGSWQRLKKVSCLYFLIAYLLKNLNWFDLQGPVQSVC